MNNLNYTLHTEMYSELQMATRHFLRHKNGNTDGVRIEQRRTVQVELNWIRLIVT